MKNSTELLEEFGTAINNLLLDMIEDATEDALGDIDALEMEDEQVISSTLTDQEAREQIANQLAAIVLAKLTVCLSESDTWAALREIYPRSPFL